MSGILNKMLDFVGWEAAESEEDFYENDNDYLEDISMKNETEQKNEQTSSSNKVYNLTPSSSNLKVVVLKPQDFDDARELCDHIRSNKPIIANLENVEKETAQRIVDFISGCIYSLDGNIQKISSGIFLATPHNVDIMSDMKGELKGKASFPWA